MNQNYDYRINIILIGDYGVGKTSLVERYFDDIFGEPYILTIGIDFKIKKMEINEKIYEFLVWDTAGAERFRRITSSYYRLAHGIMLVYDVTNQESFDNLKYWMKDIQRYSNDNVNIMLIGTKSDLVFKKVIDTESGEKFAEQLGIPFFETSSKENINVNDAFETFFKQVGTRIIQTNDPNNQNQQNNQNQNQNKNQNKKCLCF